jgi:3-deoxy-D-manno-octulosonic-acid transferase
VSLPTRLWHAAATALAPLLPWHLRRRAARGKEVPARLAERWGEDAARPPGQLFWLHAASVGETVSALPVLQAMAARQPALHFLFTTGTATSAELLAARLPPELAARVQHRFVPLDVPAWVARFLDGWRPDAGAFVESELWPNLLGAAAARGIPLGLVNARMSPRSFARWRRAPGLVRDALGGFRIVLARSEADRARLAALGAPGAVCLGDLKSAAPPLPADEAALARLRATLGTRPVFLAASTHPGEETLAIAAHAALAGGIPGLLTVLVPRHPDRGAAVAAEAEAAGLAVARRRDGGAPGPDVAVYVADTLGELGLFYRLAGVALVGGTLVPHGGQNPLEPARLRCPILMGPHSWNFEEPVARLLRAGGLAPVGASAAALAEGVRSVLTNPDRAQALADAAAAVAEGQATLPGRVAEALMALLPPLPGGATETE